MPRPRSRQLADFGLGEPGTDVRRRLAEVSAGCRGRAGRLERAAVNRQNRPSKAKAIERASPRLCSALFNRVVAEQAGGVVVLRIEDTKDGSAELLAAVIDAYDQAPWHADELKNRLEKAGADRGLKLGKAQAPVRVAVTGRTVGLPLFESMEALGQDRTLTRLRSALTRLAWPVTPSLVWTSDSPVPAMRPC